MIRAGAGYSVAVNPRVAAVEATQSALRQAGLRTADAAICFASSHHGGAFPLLVRTVGETAGTGEVTGCGSIGIIAGGREIESGPGGRGAGLRRTRDHGGALLRSAIAPPRAAKPHWSWPRWFGRDWARQTCSASLPIPTTWSLNRLSRRWQRAARRHDRRRRRHRGRRDWRDLSVLRRRGQLELDFGDAAGWRFRGYRRRRAGLRADRPGPSSHRGATTT